MSRKDVGYGVRAEVFKLPGKRSADYAARIYMRGSHVATVSEPGKASPGDALLAARRWARLYRKQFQKG
ncbi:MAG: hypothetical protein AMS18_10315 [Gemmatimonas sp. SG8_17]|nr:MAG: hypothetical protein AMS18_10315 [Gemmatimonas sp. SG8_17]